MNLKLGTLVLWDQLVGTIIARDKHDYLLGWKTAEECDWLGWKIELRDIGSGCEIIKNLKDFKYAYWVSRRDVVAFGTMTRLGSKTLQKRMRDQIAQLVLTGKS